MIEIHYADVIQPLIDLPNLDKFIHELIKVECFELDTVSIVLCSDEYLYSLNVTYLNHDTLTDVITFDYSMNDLICGELFISVDRVKENAISHDVSVLQELYRVVFHGVLHLCGYKDHFPQDKKLMSEKEDFYLRNFALM